MCSVLAPSVVAHALPLPPRPTMLQAGDVVVAELLLQAGANIDSVEVLRRSPLM